MLEPCRYDRFEINQEGIKACIGKCVDFIYMYKIHLM